MSAALQTEAYLPYTSTQEWAKDPDFVVININEALARRVEEGVKALSASGFDSITDSRLAVGWEMVAKDDGEGEGKDDMDSVEGRYVPIDPEYTPIDPFVRINFYGHGVEDVLVQFVFNFAHTFDEGWCEMSGEELAAYLDKAWAESLGYVFVQLPDQGEWLCVQSAKEGGLTVTAGTLKECARRAADTLESILKSFPADATMPPHRPRPRLDIQDSQAAGLAA